MKGPPAARRRAIDRILEGTDPTFAATAAAYTAAVTQRNAMLKRIKGQVAGVAGLTPWDRAVAEHGAAVATARSTMILDLQPRFARWMEELGGCRWDPRVGALSRGRPDGPHRFHEHLDARLAANRTRDIQAAQTLSGPPEDDVWIGIGDQDLRRQSGRAAHRGAGTAARVPGAPQ